MVECNLLYSSEGTKEWNATALLVAEQKVEGDSCRFAWSSVREFD